MQVPGAAIYLYDNRTIIPNYLYENFESALAVLCLRLGQMHRLKCFIESLKCVSMFQILSKEKRPKYRHLVFFCVGGNIDK